MWWAHTLELDVEGYFKKLEILTVPSQYIYSMMSFFIGNQEKFQTNSSVHNINTRNKHRLHRPVANLSCFQRDASYSRIRIFNSLPRSITNLKNEKTQFKVALKKFLNTRSFYSVDELFTCTNDMYYWLYDFFFISHVPLLVVILHAFFHIYNYCTKFVNTYNYCFILRCFGFFNVTINFVKRKCVYKFNKVLIVFLH